VKHDAGDLRLLSDLLDQCADLAGPGREAWLSGLTGDAERLRPSLRRMLAREAAGDLQDFLESPPDFVAPGGEAPSSDFKADECVGPYRLLRPVGRGGMGEVWLATRSDGQLKRSVALKLPVLSVRRSVLAQRFERERDILGALIHPHIARLYDAGVAEDGQPYMALEYVEGTPITQAADERALDARARVGLLRQAMDAVQYAHANLVIHRDLKPGNVLATAGGQAKLLDFGIAKLVEDEAGASTDSELTRLSGRVLTLRYAAPELINGGAASTAVDIWALGVLLYELLTGLRPFGGEGSGSVEHDILTRDPTPPSQCRSGAIAKLSRSLAGDLDTIALMALKKDPAQRYATVGAFADDLDRWLRGEPVRAQRDSMGYRARRFVGRHKIAVSAAALAAMAVIGTASAAVVFGLQARDESARAVAARDFMVDIFRRADPDLSQGQEVSAKQLLDDSYRSVLETMQPQPLLQAELLRGIGTAFGSMDELPASDEAYARAAAGFQRVGDLREAAALTLDRAGLRLSERWDVPAAAKLLVQAGTMYPTHPGDEEFLARQAILYAYAADIEGDKRTLQEWYERARLHADRTFGDTSSRTVAAVRMLAAMEGQNGIAERGIHRLEVLLDRLKIRTASAPADLVSVMVDLGLVEKWAGRYADARHHYEEATALCQRALNPKGSQCTYAQFHRSGVLLMLGQGERAMDALPYLVLPAARVDTSWGTFYATQAYEILGANRRLGDSPEVAAIVRAAGETTDGQGELWRGMLLALQAQTRQLLRQDLPQQAQAVSDRALALISTRALSDSRFAVAAFVLQALVAHALGQHDVALKLLDRVHADRVRGLGAEHPLTQIISVQRARPLWATHRREEALALIDHALPILRRAMGADAPTFVQVQALREELASTQADTPQLARKVDLFFF
jgi:eukaryotic-like serine/threonine-protein kinase